MTLGALMQEVARQDMRLIVTTARTHKDVRPTMAFDFFQASLLGGKILIPVMEVGGWLLHNLGFLKCCYVFVIND